MRIADLLVREAILHRVSATGREATVRALVDALAGARSLDAARAVRDLAARDRGGTTFVPYGPDGVALPHASTDACRQLVVAVATSPDGVPWDGAGRRARVVFLLLGPPAAQSLHLRVLGRIARLCETEGFLDAIVAADSPEAVRQVVVAAEEPLGEFEVVEGLPRFCVLGAGHGGLAMAAHLALLGCRVNLYNRTRDRLLAVEAQGGIQVLGEVEGFAPVALVTTDPAEALRDVEVAMVVIPAVGHAEMAEAIAPHLSDGQILILNPGRTGGALQVARIIRERNRRLYLYLGEAQTLLYTARVTNPGQVRIFGVKNSVPLATLPAYQIADVLPVIRRALPQFVPGDNVLKTSLDNIGAVFHPSITILNAARIEDTHGDFDYYVEGVTPSVATVLEAIDRERVAVASALGIRANTAREWLYLAYDAAGKTLLDAMQANPGYRGVTAPRTLHHRYITEDVPTSLVPIASIGEMLGVPTPTIRAMIHMASIMHGVDYWAEGRTVEQLGLRGMSVREIRFLVVGADASSPPVGGEPPVAAGGGAR